MTASPKTEPALSSSLAANTYTGNTTINQGWLDVGASGPAGTGRTIFVAAGAGVRFTTVTNALLNRLDQTSNEFTVISSATGRTSSNSNDLDFSSATGANLPNAFFGGSVGNNSPTVYSGTLTPASDNYRLGSVFGGGVFFMNNSAAMTGSQGLIVGGNTELIGAKTFTGDTVVRAGFRLGLAAFTGSSDALGLQNSVLDTTASGGTIWLETPANTPTGAVLTTSATFGGLKGNKDLSSVVNASQGGNNTGATAVTSITGFTLNLGTGNTVTYSGAIGGFGAGEWRTQRGASTLTKTGDGTQILTGSAPIPAPPPSTAARWIWEPPVRSPPALR